MPQYVVLKYIRHYRKFINEIDNVESFEELSIVEKDVNEFVKNKKIKVYHALILRNSIEQKETEMIISEKSDDDQSLIYAGSGGAILLLLILFIFVKRRK